MDRGWPEKNAEWLRIARFDLFFSKQRVEVKRLERDRPVHQTERPEQLADPRLGGEHERAVRPALLEDAECRDGEQDVA